MNNTYKYILYINNDLICILNCELFYIISFTDLLAANPKVTSPEFQLLILFSDCMSHLLTILDDVEMYEKQKPFALGHFIILSTVINQFLFKALWSNLILDTMSPLFSSLHSLLNVLYRRDNRRPFTKANHWLIKGMD